MDEQVVADLKVYMDKNGLKMKVVASRTGIDINRLYRITADSVKSRLTIEEYGKIQRLITGEV